MIWREKKKEIIEWITVIQKSEEITELGQTGPQSRENAERCISELCRERITWCADCVGVKHPRLHCHVQLSFLLCASSPVCFSAVSLVKEKKGPFTPVRCHRSMTVTQVGQMHPVLWCFIDKKKKKKKFAGHHCEVSHTCQEASDERVTCFQTHWCEWPRSPGYLLPSSEEIFLFVPASTRLSSVVFFNTIRGHFNKLSDSAVLLLRVKAGHERIGATSEIFGWKWFVVWIGHSQQHFWRQKWGCNFNCLPWEVQTDMFPAPSSVRFCSFISFLQWKKWVEMLAIQ